MPDPAFVNDGIDFTKANPVNESNGIDPFVISCGNKGKFSGNKNDFSLPPILRLAIQYFSNCFHDS